jgi:hypothetical protein
METTGERQVLALSFLPTVVPVVLGQPAMAAVAAVNLPQVLAKLLARLALGLGHQTLTPC